MADSLQSLKQWVGRQLGDQGVTLQPLCPDASRRRYYRLKNASKSYVVADASAEKTEVPAFVDIAALLAEQRIRVPIIYASDYVHGYFLESDLGDITLLSVLNDENVDELYEIAFAILLKMQAIPADHYKLLPAYNGSFIKREWNVFTNWYLEKYKGVNLTEQQTLLDNMVTLFTDVFSEQPQVFVHRDFHSRNLMVQGEQNRLALIDFQGAVSGPITYDLVSLLKGCYIDWPTEKVRQLALKMQPKLWSLTNLAPVDEATFMRWFDLTGLQRHLKVLGQFARKTLSENNDSYMKDMPRVIKYVRDTCATYEELQPFHQFMSGLL